jgi:hypothetical protein
MNNLNPQQVDPRNNYYTFAQGNDGLVTANSHPLQGNTTQNIARTIGNLTNFFTTQERNLECKNKGDNYKQKIEEYITEANVPSEDDRTELMASINSLAAWLQPAEDLPLAGPLMVRQAARQGPAHPPNQAIPPANQEVPPAQA